MPTFSSRTSWDLAESTFAAAVRALRASGTPLLDLTISNPTLCGFRYDPAYVLNGLASPGALVYEADARGIPSAREAVAAYYADHAAAIDPGAILLTTSTSEAYGYLFKLLCNAGDEVLVAQPGYPLFDFLADLEDITLRPYPLFYDYGWWIDFAQLERRIGPRTRAVLVVHPNNPTGHWTGQQERQRLYELCERHDLALIVDEVFLDYPMEEAPTGTSPDAASFAAGEHPALTFVLSGMSKIAGLPQMKAAWMVALGPQSAQREAMQRLEMIADTFLSMNAPVQHALPGWLAGRHDIQRQIQTRVRANHQVVHHAGLIASRVDAGWSATLRVRLTAEELMQHTDVITHPGSFYGMPEPNRIVVSLLTPEDDFQQGIARLTNLRQA